MDDFLKMAMDMVKAQASVRTMSAEEMASMVLELSKKLSALAGCATASVTPPPAEVAGPAMDPKKSIKEKSITCLECGRTMKLLTAKHLSSHGLTKAEYLAKYGMKKGTSLLAKGLARARKEKMKSMELWKRRGTKGVGTPEKPSASKKTTAAKKAAPKK